MANNGLPLTAVIILDNCVIGMLCDCCLDIATGMSRGQIIPYMTNWVCNHLSILRSFTPDGMLHSSIVVSDEFDGYAGKLSEYINQEHADCRQLVNDLKAEINSVEVSDEDIAVIRGLPGFPIKMFNTNQLSNNDISLAVLAIQLAIGNDRVFVLTNDQQLLWFMSWLRTKREARGIFEGNPRLVEGVHGLTYLESVHRVCTISTGEMVQILQYAFKAHYSRSALAGTKKGENILSSLLTVQSSLTESIRIKVSGGDA